jgi:hypothetical protein
MSFTNVLSVGMATANESEIELQGFSSSAVGRMFVRRDGDEQFDGNLFCSTPMCTVFYSCLSVTTMGEC